ncbi:MAG: TlpA disulfide reductase family protein [Bacteroidia bacterium]|nr:TlpA disulfide reductase family protein [Bacteroidia bacterium]
MHPRLIVSIICLCSLVQAQAQRRTVVTGEIRNGGAVSEATLYYYPYGEALAEFPVSVLAAPDAAGRFRMELELDAPRVVKFMYGEETSLYLVPGDSLHLSVDTEAFDESLRCTGTGASAGASSYLAAHFLRFADPAEGLMEDLGRQLEAGDAAAFGALLDAGLAARRRFLDSAHQASPLDPGFAAYTRAADGYWHASLKLRGPLMMLGNDAGRDRPEYPAGYLDFLGTVELQQDAWVGMKEYEEFLAMRMVHEALQAGRSGGEALYQRMWEASGQLLSGRPRTVTRANLLIVLLEDAGGSQAMQFMKEFEAEAEIPEVLAHLQTLAARLAPLLEGAPAPGFELEDLKGGTVSLADFRGKVVYIDFWASWCGPCLREMPYSHELIGRFKGQDVVFLYISLDEDAQSWKKAVAKLKLPSPQLRAAQGSGVGEAYQIESIPRYVIVGRDGTLFSGNAERPSSSGIDAQLQAALKQR